MKGSQRKKRLDQRLAELRTDLSRSRIQAEIMAGRVFVNGRKCDKPGTPVDDSAGIELRENENPFVSRGGLKLQEAVHEFNLELKDLTVLDVGASTGGFTDCLLQNGARLVYALDVGYGQLSSILRNDLRVIVMERKNIRTLRNHDLPTEVDLAVIDVSFISLKKVVPVLREMKVQALLALLKPQFEVGRKEATRGKGIIRDPNLHRAVIEEIIRFSCLIDYCCIKITFSKWPGPKGNIEYFIYLELQPGSGCNCSSDPAAIAASVVKDAHLALLGNKI